VHIQNHLDDPLDLDRLAALAYFSPFHFHRVFRGMVGEPVKAHIRRLRLERAAAELKTGRRSVTDVAFDAGYEAHESFTRAFRARFGQSPSDYRDTHRSASPSGVCYSPDGVVSEFDPQLPKGATMDAEITTIDPMTVAFVRHTGPYTDVGRAWEQLCGWAGPKGLLGADSQMFGVCYDDPEVTPPDKIRYDACLVVGADAQPAGEIGVQDVGGGRYATLVHRGPYTRLAEAYAALVGQWMPAQDLEPTPGRPSLEFYLNDPQRTPEAELETRICMPVETP